MGKPPQLDIFQLSSDHYDLGSFASLGLRASLPAFVEWSLESLTSQCYGLCAPNPSTKARVRHSGAPSYDRFCPLRKPLLGSWPAQALIDGRNTTNVTPQFVLHKSHSVQDLYLILAKWSGHACLLYKVNMLETLLFLNCLLILIA